MSNFTPAWIKKGFFNESIFCDDFPDTFLSAVVHMDEKTPHLHLCFVYQLSQSMITFFCDENSGMN